MEDLTQDEVDDSDVMGDRPQIGEVFEFDSPSLANSVNLEGWGPTRSLAGHGPFRPTGVQPCIL